MPFKLVEGVADEEFSELITCEWESFEDPPVGFLRIFCPILNEDRASSLVKSTEGQLAQYKSEQPESIWIKVIDTDTNKIVGAANWKINEKNPFAEPPKEPFQAVWYPEGPGREFATQAILQIVAPRVTMAQRPHAFLNIAFTHPSYRRRGIGNLWMKWGTEKADALGIECWLEASDMGYPLYEKHGFVPASEITVDPPEPEGLSEADKAEWERVKAICLPTQATTMWRPAGGKYEEGVTVKPWEVKN